MRGPAHREKDMSKIAHYSVINASGAIIKHFAADFAAAKAFAKASEGSGLLYGLRVKRYYVVAA